MYIPLCMKHVHVHVEPNTRGDNGLTLFGGYFEWMILIYFVSYCFWCVVPDPPESVSLNAGSPSYFSLVATWTPPSTDETVFSSYSLQLSRDDVQTSVASVSVASDVTSYQFDDLLPETNYSVQVRTVSEGEGYTTISPATEGYGGTGKFDQSSTLYRAAQKECNTYDH